MIATEGTIDPEGTIDEGLLDELTARVGERLVALRSRIDAVRRGDQSIEIVAVTKGFGPEAPLAALRNGLTMLGENYADELVAKARVVGARADLTTGLSPRWTFQGRLQSNKINRLLPFVDVWQSLDTRERVDALAKRQPAANICIQVRLTDDHDRSGADPDEIAALVDHARSAGLRVLGLMGVGPDPDLVGIDASRRAFRLLNDLCGAVGVAWRSMGMSSDFEQAIQEGATHIRIGTALVRRPITGRTEHFRCRCHDAKSEAVSDGLGEVDRCDPGHFHARCFCWSRRYANRLRRPFRTDGARKFGRKQVCFRTRTRKVPLERLSVQRGNTRRFMEDGWPAFSTKQWISWG